MHQKINTGNQLPFAKPGIISNSGIDNQLHYLRNSREIARHTADRLIELRTPTRYVTTIKCTHASDFE